MISSLIVKDIVLIERLELEFGSGLSVLTGETGAGKSILLDSLSLALGGRGDGDLVRAGATEGSVTAVFELAQNHPVTHLLGEHDIDVSDGLILRRVQKADGKTRAYVNDAPVSAGLLRNIGNRLVEIHGQHDDRAMLDATTHCGLLDAHGGLMSLVSGVGDAWKAWRGAQKDLDVLKAQVEEAQREAAYLRSSCEELTLLAPEPGEETALAEQRQKLMKIEQIASDLAEANEELSGNASPVTTISNLARRLERKREQVPELVDETLAHLDTALNALYAAQTSLESGFRQTEFDPQDLESSEERLFALRAAARKFNVAVENLPDLAIKMADDLAMLEDGADRLAKLEEEVRILRKRYFEAAGELSERRSEAGRVLAEQVMSELPSLKLEKAEFIVHQSSEEEHAGASGIDLIEFWVRTNPGSKPGPMRKVASGGELSRFMLALKVALADRGSAPTLVFDEIDSGVGGAVSDAIGKRLVRLSHDVQVLTVTHAPQVAARASGHYLISKGASGDGSQTSTEVVPIFDKSRLEEIARMLSGASITDEARAAAKKLISQTAA